MSAQASTPVTPVTPAKENGKHKIKSDKKRRHEESVVDSVPTKTKRQKHGEVNDDDAVRRSGKQDKKEKKEKKETKIEKKETKNERDPLGPRSLPSLKKGKRPEAEHTGKPQSNGTAHDDIPELLDASQMTEASDATEKKERKRRKREKKQKTTPTESTTNGMGDGDGDAERPVTPADEAPESTEAPDEPVTSAEAPFTFEDKSLGVDLLNSPDPSSFYSTRISLYLPIPAITLPHHAISALLSRHLAPLLLTYFPPVKGIVLAFQDTVMSANASTGVNHPLKPPTDDQYQTEDDDAHVKQVLAQASDQQGVAWVWLTVTFLVFNPQRGDQLYGVNNVASEGFVGLVSYNYFQISVGAKRIPSEWKWRGPETSQGRKQKRLTKGKMDQDGRWSESSPVPAELSQSSVADERSRVEIESDTGFYLESGDKVDNVMKFKVVDTDMVAGSHRGEWALHVDGTLLDDDAEKLVREEEMQAWERQHKRQETPGTEVSGGLVASREGSAMSGP